MEHRHRLHIIDADSRGRAQLARIAYALGHHAEVYSGWDELMRHPPRDGILVARDELGGAAELGGISRSFGKLGEKPRPSSTWIR